MLLSLLLAIHNTDLSSIMNELMPNILKKEIALYMMGDMGTSMWYNGQKACLERLITTEQ